MQLNSYNLYAMNTGFAPKVDEVDAIRLEIENLREYNIVKDYIEKNFGVFEGEKEFDYPELEKKLFVKQNKNQIEFLATKNEERYCNIIWSFQESSDDIVFDNSI